MFEGIIEKGLVCMCGVSSFVKYNKSHKSMDTGKRSLLPLGFCIFQEQAELYRGLLLGKNKTKAESKFISHSKCHNNEARTRLLVDCFPLSFAPSRKRSALTEEQRMP